MLCSLAAILTYVVYISIHNSLFHFSFYEIFDSGTLKEGSCSRMFCFCVHSLTPKQEQHTENISYEITQN